MIEEMIEPTFFYYYDTKYNEKLSFQNETGTPIYIFQKDCFVDIFYNHDENYQKHEIYFCFGEGFLEPEIPIKHKVRQDIMELLQREYKIYFVQSILKDNQKYIQPYLHNRKIQKFIKFLIYVTA